MKNRKCRRTSVYHRLYPFLRVVAWPFFTARYPMRISADPEVRALEGSHLLFGNHVNKWDPFLVAGGYGKPVSFIASDHLFRSPILAWLLPWLGAIAKKKFQPDTVAIRQMFAVRDCGGVMGVFPEGHVNWGGRTLPVVPSTAKLVKLLKVPVVIAKIRGGYHQRPRWMGRRVPGTYEVHFSLLYSRAQVLEKSVDELLDGIQEALTHDEWSYLRNAARPFRAKERAHLLERALFTCPDCARIGTMRSAKHRIGCSECGYRAEVDPRGFLLTLSGTRVFKDIGAWDAWQKEKLREALSADPSAPIFEDFPCQLLKGEGGGRLKEFTDWGSLRLYADRIEFDDSVGGRLSFDLARVDGTTVQESEEAEFYYGSDLFRLRFKDSRVSAYKWFLAHALFDQLRNTAATAS